MSPDLAALVGSALLGAVPFLRAATSRPIERATLGRYTWTRPIATRAEVEALALAKVQDRFVSDCDLDRLERDLAVALTDPRALLTPAPPPPPVLLRPDPFDIDTRTFVVGVLAEGMNPPGPKAEGPQGTPS